MFEKHPLYETPLYLTLPFLKPFRCLWCLCPAKKQFSNIKHARVNSVSDKDKLEDPFLGFGFGVYGYFNFITISIVAYSFLSLLAIP